MGGLETDYRGVVSHDNFVGGALAGKGKYQVELGEGGKRTSSLALRK